MILLQHVARIVASLCSRTPPKYLCDMTLSYVTARHGPFVCVKWLIHTCDRAHPHVWHDPFTCVPWPIQYIADNCATNPLARLHLPPPNNTRHPSSFYSQCNTPNRDCTIGCIQREVLLKSPRNFRGKDPIREQIHRKSQADNAMHYFLPVLSPGDCGPPLDFSASSRVLGAALLKSLLASGMLDAITPDDGSLPWLCVQSSVWVIYITIRIWTTRTLGDGNSSWLCIRGLV